MKIQLFKKSPLKDEKMSFPKNSKNAYDDTGLWRIFVFSSKSTLNLK